MSFTRRAVLRTGTASVLILAAGGYWASRQHSVTARSPWRAASAGFGDPRLDALAYAILAPNPPNMQPWQVRLEGEDAFMLYADPARMLPHTDPPARQITIGFGCFLELLRQAAAEKGYLAVIDAFPDGEPQPQLDARPIARVRLQAMPEIPKDPLFANVLTRHTQRLPFDMQRGVSAQALERLRSVATAGVDVAVNARQPLRDELRALTTKAWITEWENGPTREESVSLMRIGKTEVEAKPWGLTMDGAFIGTLGAVGLVSREAMRTPGELSYEQGLSGYVDACNSAMAHIWSTTPTNTRRDQLNAGATWVRVHQAAAREGLSFHPLSQALQEFPVMQEHYRAVHGLLAAPGHTVQMLVRLGFSTAAGPAPREPLTAKLLPA